MATQPIHAEAAYCKGARDAYFDAECRLEQLMGDLERVSETSYALATSEAFETNAKHSFYLLGSMTERMHERAKIDMARYNDARRTGGDQ